MEYMIETDGLTKHYTRGRIKALSDFTIKIKKGTIFSLLGPNGAGKTTLVKLLLSIVSPTKGMGKISGIDISNANARLKVGYLAENHRFPDFLNAKQVLFHYGKMSFVDNSILKVKIPKLLKEVGLEDKGKIKVKKFSKGMLQRLGIAQALINDPDLLFLDEPTDGIDPVGRREIREILLKLKEEGKTIFINSHLLSEVERISDEVAILKDGKLLKHGSIEDFISVRDKYKIHLAPINDDVLTISETTSNKTEKEILEKFCLEKHIDLIYNKDKDFFTITVIDKLQLNNLIDYLRESNIIIEGIVPVKISLEDYFINVIEK